MSLSAANECHRTDRLADVTKYSVGGNLNDRSDDRILVVAIIAQRVISSANAISVRPQIYSVIGVVLSFSST